MFNGGAEIIEASSGEILKQQKLSKEAMQELVKLSLPFGYETYTDTDQYGTPLTSPDDITDAASKYFIKAVKTADAIHMSEEIAAVKTAIGHPTTSWEKGDVVDIHVTHIHGTKRHGVEKLIAILGVDKESTLGIGDSHNDLPLLEAVGFKIVMGNAPSEVKALADYIAPTLDEDGVAEAIEHFIL